MRRIVRTTRRTQIDDGNEEPVETMHERQVVRVVPEEEDMRSNDETRAIRPWIRGLQNATQRQFAQLRDMDFRLANSEEQSRLASAASSEASLERASFWVLWVTLMVVLGAALAIVLVLILMSIVH